MLCASTYPVRGLNGSPVGICRPRQRNTCAGRRGCRSVSNREQSKRFRTERESVGLASLHPPDSEVPMATIHDVAEAAGVSISTVSYALSGKRSIASTTRQRVTEAVDRLGYRPHAGARMLAGARTNILALSAPVRPDNHQPTQMRFVTAVVEAARRRDYDVLLLATDDEVSGIRRVASSSLVDGVVAIGVATVDERVDLVRELALPAGFIGIPQGADDLACIDLDFETAAAMSVDRLADAGHRVVGVVGHPASYQERDTGFIRRFDDAFAARAQVRGLETVTIPTDLSRASGGRAFDELRARLPGMTALVLHCSEPTAEAVLQRIRQLGLEIPRDLSVLAAAASYAADELEPALDMIPLPIDEMCRRAVEAAFERIDGRLDRGVELIAPVYLAQGSVTVPTRAS
ncbi:LacI family DNA-binding transcriptional regulator [Frigoribacterium sp. CFBP 8754]|uniref:LacI family DNA-binding transcriptional regulator n=2 Tax=Microbacteriaceae TaxID=85023 RepID=UPI00352BFE2D